VTIALGVDVYLIPIEAVRDIAHMSTLGRDSGTALLLQRKKQTACKI
jgi:hypothetical protein